MEEILGADPESFPLEDDEDYFDTSDSEEVDNPVSRNGRRRNRRTDVLGADAIVGLDGVVFVRYEDYIQQCHPAINTGENAIASVFRDVDAPNPLLEAARRIREPLTNKKKKRRKKKKKKKKKNKKNGKAAVPVPSVATDDTPHDDGGWYYPLLGSPEKTAGIVPDFHSTASIEAACDDQAMCIRDVSLLGTPPANEEETAIDRIRAIAVSNDRDRVGRTSYNVSVDNTMTAKLDGYVESLGKTMFAQSTESSVEIADAATVDALDAALPDDVQIPIGKVDAFYDRDKGDIRIFNDVEAMAAEAASPECRSEHVKRVMEREYAADRTYRRWGCTQRPIGEHDQWLGSPVNAVYIDDFLRPAEPHFDERPCVLGSRCISLILPALKSFPRTMDDSTRKPGFIGREFLLPEHMTVYRAGASSTRSAAPLQRSFLDEDGTDAKEEEEEDAPEVIRLTPEQRSIGGACVIDILFRQTRACWQVLETGKPWAIQIQYFEVETSPPHGYPPDRLLPIIMPKTGVPTGIISPALAFVVDDYHLSTRTIRSLDGTFEREVPCYVQVARHF